MASGANGFQVDLNENEVGIICQILTGWAIDPKESRIVRTLSIHGLFNLLTQYPKLKQDFQLIPSVNARLRKLKKLKR